MRKAALYIDSLGAVTQGEVEVDEKTGELILPTHPHICWFYTEQGKICVHPKFVHPVEMLPVVNECHRLKESIRRYKEELDQLWKNMRSTGGTA